jgi:hypothetical protein
MPEENELSDGDRSYQSTFQEDDGKKIEFNNYK